MIKSVWRHGDSSPSLYTLSGHKASIWWMITSWKGFRRNWSLPDRCIILEGLKKTTRDISQCSWCSCRALNRMLRSTEPLLFHALVTTDGIKAWVWTRDLPNTKDVCFPLDHDGRYLNFEKRGPKYAVRWPRHTVHLKPEVQYCSTVQVERGTSIDFLSNSLRASIDLGAWVGRCSEVIHEKFEFQIVWRCAAKQPLSYFGCPSSGRVISYRSTSMVMANVAVCDDSQETANQTLRRQAVW
jgi:hypothetical protein